MPKWPTLFFFAQILYERTKKVEGNPFFIFDCFIHSRIGYRFVQERASKVSTHRYHVPK